MRRLGLACVSPTELSERGSQPILDWLRSTDAKHLAIRLDLDVLDPAIFRALLCRGPRSACETCSRACH